MYCGPSGSTRAEEVSAAGEKVSDAEAGCDQGQAGGERQAAEKPGREDIRVIAGLAAVDFERLAIG